jgi:hypothetical protein
MHNGKTELHLERLKKESPGFDLNLTTAAVEGVELNDVWKYSYTVIPHLPLARLLSSNLWSTLRLLCAHAVYLPRFQNPYT